MTRNGLADEVGRMEDRPTVRIEESGPIWTVILDRPDRRNAVDGPTARHLADAFRSFEAEPSALVAVLYGAGGTFCSGADLHAMSNSLDPDPDADGPMGPTRMTLTKPVIAAISGYAVAGGLELALWCDLRVVEADAVFGVFSRHWGVPLIDGGTIRLPRIVGLGRALDMIITGREVDADEAFAMGLASRVVASGTAWTEAKLLATEIAHLPQDCLRSDRRSVYAALAADERTLLAEEFGYGQQVMSGARRGAARFAAGERRHGTS